MSMNCIGCNNRGHIAVINGDDDIPCPICGGLDTPAPVVITVGVYSASVANVDGIFHLDCLDFGFHDLQNAFCGDYERALAIGRALILACPDEPTKWSGYDYFLGQTVNVGSLEFRGKDFDQIPSYFTASAAHECGVALIQMGAIMNARRGVEKMLKQAAEAAELVVAS